MTEQLTPFRWPYPPSLFITPQAPEAIGNAVNLAGFFSSGLVAAPWNTANRAFIYPFRLDRPFTVTKVFNVNGSTAAGSFDIGVYTADASPVRLFSSGGTAQSGTSVVQEVDVTDYTLGHGRYYLAMSANNVNTTSLNRKSGSVAFYYASFGAAIMDTAYVLPSTLTLATMPAATIFPSFGIASRTLVA